MRERDPLVLTGERLYSSLWAASSTAHGVNAVPPCNVRHGFLITRRPWFSPRQAENLSNPSTAQ
jgi:hypothetical protein